MKTIKLEYAGAALLVILGIIVAVAPMPAQRSVIATARAAGVSLQTDKDSVTPDEVAQWIIEKRPDVEVVDVRNAWEFADYSIPGARNIPLADVSKAAADGHLAKEKMIVLCSNQEKEAAQAWTLFSLAGYHAYILKGGLQAWWDEVLAPVSLLPVSLEEKVKIADEHRAIRAHFLGQPRTPARSATAPPPPVPVMPAAPTVPAGGPRHAEGC